MKIFLYETMNPAGMNLLREYGDVVTASAVDDETVIREAQGAAALIIRANGFIGREVIDALPDLRVIGKHGVGYDNIDAAYALSKGVRVVYTPNAPSNSTAEHAIGLLFSLSRKIPQLHGATRAGRWGVRNEIRGGELYGKTLGVIGMGRIGKRIAEIASRGIRMRVLYTDPVRTMDIEALFGLGYARSIEELLPQCDFVSVNVPLTDATRGLITGKMLGRMKRTACLVNTSRGPVVDQNALTEALREGRIAGAALDVFEPEPLPADSPLLSMDNVIVTPHTAGMSDESMVNMSLVAQDVIAVLKGREPQYPVVV